MAKIKTEYVCQSCGYDSPKWLGKCPSCGEWNTFVEEVIAVASKNSVSTFSGGSIAKPIPISKVEAINESRLDTGNQELNRVLGGGLVSGSMVLIGGEPGIGKSTLVLQVALNFPGNKKILYVSGEESAQQIRLRANRISGNLENCYVLSETAVENILTHTNQEAPDVLVIDSIQTITTSRAESAAGSVTQIRESTAIILRHAKESGIPVILIGHITKEGSLAGPKVLEHMVDTVLQFEGDSRYMYRILRSIKNRFGSTSEIGIYEMRGDGLREVANPSEILLSDEHKGLSGISVAAMIEGNRPVLIEVQALVSSAVYGTPQRSSTGFDLRRLNMLLAVLEKRLGFKIGTKDVFLNIAGGLKVEDTAIDLAVLAAVFSSSLDQPIKNNVCIAGEVGLSGEIRAVARIEQRIAEAEKLGFTTMIIPAGNQKSIQKTLSIKLIPVSRLDQALRLMVSDK